MNVNCLDVNFDLNAEKIMLNKIIVRLTRVPEIVSVCKVGHSIKLSRQRSTYDFPTAKSETFQGSLTETFTYFKYVNTSHTR